MGLGLGWEGSCGINTESMTKPWRGNAQRGLRGKGNGGWGLG